jgi:hypothetical protein
MLMKPVIVTALCEGKRIRIRNRGVREFKVGTVVRFHGSRAFEFRTDAGRTLYLTPSLWFVEEVLSGSPDQA